MSANDSSTNRNQSVTETNTAKPLAASPQRSEEAARTAMQSKSFHPYPWYSPRFWHGMRLGDWLQLVSENRFRIHPSRIPMAMLLCGVTSFNSLCAAVQALLHDGRIRATNIDVPPVFIIGHWRSGTTLLHELMTLDSQFASPNTYECFAPHHCLVTSRVLPTLSSILLPKSRPMDNMASGWHMPQEDEFALLTLGAPTPYRRMAFPNHKPADDEFIDMVGVDPERLERWRHAMRYFVQLLTYRYGRRVLLKSPPHTGRLDELSRLFPGAKFIHIARNPYSIFASTRRLWYALDDAQACQRPHHQQTDEYILDCFERMYASFLTQRERLPEGHISYTSYESLTQDPVAEIERLYEELDLGDFEEVRAGLEAQAESRAGYRPNRHSLDEELRAEVTRRWQPYFEAFGYEAS